MQREHQSDASFMQREHQFDASFIHAESASARVYSEQTLLILLLRSFQTGRDFTESLPVIMNCQAEAAFFPQQNNAADDTFSI